MNEIIKNMILESGLCEDLEDSRFIFLLNAFEDYIDRNTFAIIAESDYSHIDEEQFKNTPKEEFLNALVNTLSLEVHNINHRYMMHGGYSGKNFIEVDEQARKVKYQLTLWRTQCLRKT